MCAQLHFNMCEETGVNFDNKHRYEHTKELVEIVHEIKVTVLWNQQVQNDRTIPNSKTDIIIRDNKQGRCMLIDVANPGDRNVIKK